MQHKSLLAEDILAIDCLEACSLSFLALMLLENKDDILLFSAQNYLLVKSELNHLKINSDIFADFQERVDFTFIKPQEKEDKEIFFEYFESKVKAFKGSMIYFDRVDYFLDASTQKRIEPVLKRINKIVKQYDKKLLYVYNSKSDKHNAFDKAIKKNTTILDLNHHDKEDIMPPFQALQEELLDELKRTNTEAFNGQESDSKVQVMLMSDSNELKKLHYYIFTSTDDVDYYTIDVLPEDEMSLIEDMDIILYNKKDAKLKHALLKKIKTQKLPVKFFEITNAEYLRQKDLLISSIEGVDKLFKKDFLLEDYIISIEMYLQSNFYSKRLLDLGECKELLLTKKEMFEARIQELLTKKVFFSLLTYTYDADNDITAYNLQKIVREYDNIYVNKRKNEISFIILSTIPDFAHTLIQSRMQNFSITLEKQTSHSSFDLIFD